LIESLFFKNKLKHTKFYKTKLYKKILFLLKFLYIPTKGQIGEQMPTVINRYKELFGKKYMLLTAFYVIFLVAGIILVILSFKENNHLFLFSVFLFSISFYYAKKRYKLFGFKSINYLIEFNYDLTQIDFFIKQRGRL
jgi:hypothetical protein